MPCGPLLIEAVAAQLHVQNGKKPNEIRYDIHCAEFPSRPHLSLRAIRYAITELIKTGRARRQGNKYGPVYAVVQE